jgi:uncharacterized protein YbaP (TraB family)
MSRRRPFSLLLLLTSVQLAACATTPPAREPEMLVFWHVSRADGARGSAHLLGSMHLTREQIALDPAIERALSEADAIALEVAPQDLAPEALLELVVSLGQLPPGQSLAQLVGARTLKRLERRVAASAVPFATWLRWEPWLVTMMLANDQLATAGFRPEAGVEPQLGARAEREQKPVRGLETAREQIERFDSLPLATQELLLRDTLDSEKQRHSDDTVERAWRRGDLEALAHVLFSSPTGEHAPAFFEAIYFDRNRDFAEDVAELIESGGRWFVALGAGHMLGELGVPQLLAARGYRVERVPRTPGAAPVPVSAPSDATPQEPDK